MTEPTMRPAVPATHDLRRVMPPDQFLTAVDGIDFDAMMDLMSGRRTDPAALFASEDAAERLRVARAAARLWADETYRPLIEWLLDTTLRRPISIWGLGEAKSEYIDRREGANSVVWQLLRMVAEGRNEEPPTREGTDP